MDPADEMFQLCRFDLTPLEAVAYYLPRLLSGESLSFKKGIKKEKESTGWVMEEYHCLLPEAVVADGEMVLCKIHLSQRPKSSPGIRRVSLSKVIRNKKISRPQCQ